MRRQLFDQCFIKARASGHQLAFCGHGGLAVGRAHQRAGFFQQQRTDLHVLLFQA